MFYAAGARRSQFWRGHTSATSRPFTSILSSFARITTERPSVVAGQRNRLFWKRFAQIHSPLPAPD
jgi:hypothetical protein